MTAFAPQARAFIAFVEGASELPLAERLSTARLQLLALYTTALELPRGKVGTRTELEPALPTWNSFERFEHYWEVFDPYVLTEPVAGSLSDDILDIYRDVARGLALWDQGQEAAANWEWRFSFEAHWGAHAIDALRALHRATSLF